MGIEVATYINDFVSTNPVSSDDVAEGDNHLRLIKTVLQTQFPGASRPWPIPTAVAKSLDYTVVAADQNKTFLWDVSVADRTATLPTLVGADAGWECHFVKNEASTQNGIKVVAASGNILSQDNSVASIRVGQPFQRTRLYWTGSTWLVEKTGTRIGSIEIYQGAGLPRGYMWCDGSSFSATTFAELTAALAGGTAVMDLRGRVVAGTDNMGIGAANRLTSAGSGINGASIGSVGGAQNVTLAAANIPLHTHTFSTGTESNTHAHGFNYDTATNKTNSVPVGSGQTAWNGSTSAGATTDTQSVNHTHSGTTNTQAGGGSTAVVICQPTAVLNMIIRAC